MEIVTVTQKENVLTDEEGNIQFDEDQNIILHDENAIGILVRTHLVQVSQINPNTNQLETGVVPKCEVLWEHKRNPAVVFEAPDDLVWLSFGGDEEADTDQELDDDHEDYEHEDEAPANFHEV